MLDIILAFIVFLLGISVGSFLNVVADRIPNGQSIISPPSHCFNCNHELTSSDLIPVVSYLFLKGKCRYCKSIIPARSFIVEIFTGLVYVAAFLLLGLTWALLEALIYISIFVVLIITDVESHTLPHRIVYPSILLSLLISGLNTMFGFKPDIQSSIIGFALSFGLFLIMWGIPKIFNRNLMGFGDVGMAGLVGASTGFPLVTIALYLSILTGGLTALILLLFKIKSISYRVSFGMFLALGAIGVILWGKELIYIYSFITTF